MGKKFLSRVTLAVGRSAAAASAGAILALPAAQAQQPQGKDVDAAQERLRKCNRESSDREGFARNEFMSSCMKASEPRPGAPRERRREDAQAERAAACEREASARDLRGEPRDAFVRECVAGTT
jgi:hypothetical protein